MLLIQSTRAAPTIPSGQSEPPISACVADRAIVVTRSSNYHPDAVPINRADCQAAITAEASPTELVTQFEGMASGTSTYFSGLYLTPCNTSAMNPSGLRTTLVIKALLNASTAAGPPWTVAINGVDSTSVPPVSMDWSDDSDDAHGLYEWRTYMVSCPPIYCSNPFEAYPMTGRDACPVLPLSKLTLKAELTDTVTLDVTRILQQYSTLQIVVLPAGDGLGPTGVTVSARFLYSGW